jgi:hypothetical protein
MRNTPNEPPESAMTGAAFADSLAKKYASQGKNPADLFIALAGLISGRSPQVAAECLMALEGAVDGDTSAEIRAIRN